ncbi:uncharacterized protein LOC117591358 [Drosophila guanche]|uniref:uncharacterized protein LOC117591358 n=1 Tax=Drosophila guanche TaxID=7266 RepID=UPI0014718D4A|nr:uncharacterized protein LOC117591358 [Drosophila guanche]
MIVIWLVVLPGVQPLENKAPYFRSEAFSPSPGYRVENTPDFPESYPGTIHQGGKKANHNQLNQRPVFSDIPEGSNKDVEIAHAGVLIRCVNVPHDTSKHEVFILAGNSWQK